MQRPANSITLCLYALVLLLLLLFNAISFLKYLCHKVQCQQTVTIVTTFDGMYRLHCCRYGNSADHLRAALISIYTLCHFDLPFRLTCICLCLPFHLHILLHTHMSSAIGCGIIENCLAQILAKWGATLMCLWAGIGYLLSLCARVLKWSNTFGAAAAVLLVTVIAECH